MKKGGQIFIVQRAEHHHTVGNKKTFKLSKRFWVEPAQTHQTQTLKQAMTEKLKPHQETKSFCDMFNIICMMPTHWGNISARGFANHR